MILSTGDFKKIDQFGFYLVCGFLQVEELLDGIGFGEIDFGDHGDSF